MAVKLYAMEVIHEQFKDYLYFEYQNRQGRNPRYSLRAYAESLGIDSSRLSKIFRGQRPIQKKMVDQLGNKLKLPQEQIEEYKRKLATPSLLNKLIPSFPYTRLSQEISNILSRPLYFMILEAMKLKGFSSNIKWLSKKLKMKEDEIEEAIQVLIRTGQLEITQTGEWIDTSGTATTTILSPNHTSRALREFQTQLRIDSLQSLENDPIEVRSHTNIMMATNKQKIAQAKEMICDFQRQLSNFLEDTEEKDAIYQVAISLFPTTELSDE